MPVSCVACSAICFLFSPRTVTEASLTLALFPRPCSAAHTTLTRWRDACCGGGARGHIAPHCYAACSPKAWGASSW
jgi:hypothetical protein